MIAAECAKAKYRVESIGCSEWADFLSEHKGHEFYDKETSFNVLMWEIHNTFTAHEIKLIVYGQHHKYGYRIKNKEVV